MFWHVSVRHSQCHGPVDIKKFCRDTANDPQEPHGVCGFRCMLRAGPSGGCQSTSGANIPPEDCGLPECFGNNPQVIIPWRTDRDPRPRNSSGLQQDTAGSSKWLRTWVSGPLARRDGEDRLACTRMWLMTKGTDLHGEIKFCMAWERQKAVCAHMCVQLYVSYIPASFVFPVGSMSQATKSICQLTLISKEPKSLLLDAWL